MKITIVKDYQKRGISDCLFIPFWQEKTSAKCAAKIKIPASYLLPIKNKDFQGKLKEVMLFYPNSGKEKRVLFIGLGKNKVANEEILRSAYAAAIRACMKKKIKKIGVVFPAIDQICDDNLIMSVSEGLLSANYTFQRLKAKKDRLQTIEKAQFIGFSSSKKSIIDKAKTICDGMHFVRDLVNNNADEETPHHLTEVAKSFKKLSSKVSINIFDKKKLEKEKMGLILAVSKGASTPPYLIEINYRGNPHSNDHTVLVGKGVTYDTGGLSLKPTGSMDTMKADMSGGAVVLGTMYTLCRLHFPINVTALVPAVENAIGPNSYKPGDVYRSYSGKTIEVMNTDAEGRLILADALYYAAKNLQPSRIIDIASLTGAIVIALGDDIAGLFCNNDQLATQMIDAAKDTGEHLCRLPLYPGYKPLLKSKIADIRNIGKDRKAGSITASLFLEEFVSKIPWAHIDIGGTNFLNEANRYYPTHGTGYGVRLFIRFFESLLSK